MTRSWSLASRFEDSNGLLVSKNIPAAERANAKMWVASLRKQADFPRKTSKADRLLFKCDLLFEMLRRIGSEESCGTLEEIARFQALWADICDKMDVLAVTPTTAAIAGTDNYGNPYEIKGRLGEHTRGTDELVFERRLYAENIDDFEYHFARNSDVEEFFYYHPADCRDFYARYVHNDGHPEAVKIFGDGRGIVYHQDSDDTSPTILHSTRVYAPCTTIGSSSYFLDQESDSETSSSETESESSVEESSESSDGAHDEDSDEDVQPSNAEDRRMEDLVTRFTRL